MSARRAELAAVAAMWMAISAINSDSALPRYVATSLLLVWASWAGVDLVRGAKRDRSRDEGVRS